MPLFRKLLKLNECRCLNSPLDHKYEAAQSNFCFVISSSEAKFRGEKYGEKNKGISPNVHFPPISIKPRLIHAATSIR